MKIHTSVLSALLLVAAVMPLSVKAQQVGAPQAMQYGEAPAGDNHVATWFSKYDAIRRQAQMTPQEKQRADNLMSKGLSLVVPGPEKIVTQQLLSKLINKNQNAADQMKMLQLFPETAQLHRGYYQYFITASGLFSDYLRVQQDFLARDANGAMLAGGLMNRKQQLAALDEQNKSIDGQMRQQFGIPAYRY